MSRDRKDCSVAFTTQESQTPPRGAVGSLCARAEGLDSYCAGQAQAGKPTEAMGDHTKDGDRQRESQLSSYMVSFQIGFMVLAYCD